ncbi:MAG: cupin [Gemmatales bacterium]|nr:MAG: cupin [Gemmatales bacterium]
MTAEEIMHLLNLKPLPLEGGYYRETYRSADVLAAGTLERFAKAKAVCTAIYYLLTPETFSALHRLPTDEVYHFYLGDAVELVQLLPDGKLETVTLGPDLANGQQVQAVVPRGVWQGSRLRAGGRFALMGTTMAPGFDFDDYEPGEREKLLVHYPGASDWIEALTRPSPSRFE